jgi:CO dehydrogenase maturation factor
MAASMDKKTAAVINKSPSEKISEKIRKQLDAEGIEVIGVIPQDPSVFEACLDGQVPAQGEAFEKAGKILDRLLAL